MQSSVHLPGPAIIASLLLGSAIDGVVGAMIAVPMVVLAAIIGRIPVQSKER
jgi:predicted PurR-regulated permease PerM